MFQAVCSYHTLAFMLFKMYLGNVSTRLKTDFWMCTAGSYEGMQCIYVVTCGGRMQKGSTRFRKKQLDKLNEIKYFVAFKTKSNFETI